MYRIINQTTGHLKASNAWRRAFARNESREKVERIAVGVQLVSHATRRVVVVRREVARLGQTAHGDCALSPAVVAQTQLLPTVLESKAKEKERNRERESGIVCSVVKWPTFNSNRHKYKYW